MNPNRLRKMSCVLANGQKLHLTFFSLKFMKIYSFRLKLVHTEFTRSNTNFPWKSHTVKFKQLLDRTKICFHFHNTVKMECGIVALRPLTVCEIPCVLFTYFSLWLVIHVRFKFVESYYY